MVGIHLPRATRGDLAHGTINFLDCPMPKGSWCEVCGISSYNLVKIRDFKMNKVLAVCFKCSDAVREKNLIFEGSTKETQIQQEV